MTRHTALRTLFAAAVLAAPAGLVAQESSGFKLTLDPIVFEGMYLDQDTDSAKSQEYRDLSDGFRLTLMNLSGVTSDLKRQLEFQVVKGGKDDAFYGLSYDVAGAWGLELSYDNIPHNFGNNGRTLYTRTAPGRWEIQDPVQQALQGQLEAQYALNPSAINFAFLDGLIQPYLAVSNEIDIGLQRRRTRAALDLGRAGAASWQIEYRHEARTGTRNLGTSFGFNNVTELPEPIDYDTTDATLSGNWRWTGGLVTAGYRYSTFENSISTLTWDNPWRATDSTDPSAYSAPGSGSIGGSSTGFYDLAPDNDAGVVFANGRFDIGQSGWLQAAVNWTTFEQDDSLLPMTLNSAIEAPLQPYGSANREAEMLRVALDYGTRFGDGWQLGVRYHYQDYSDDSSRFSWDGYVRFHAVLEEIPRITVPFSWTRETLSANVDKDLGGAGNLSFEARRDVYDREFRETEETTEDILALKWDGRFGRALVRAKYELGERDYDGVYETEAQEASFVHPEGINNQPGLRKYDQANRDIDRWSASLDLPFAEVWTVSLKITGTEFDYADSEFGLTGDETLRYGFDLSRDAGDGGSFFLFGELAERDVSMAARQSGGTLSTNPLDDWYADFEEVNDTWGLGWNKEAEDWQLRLLGEWANSDGEADMFSPPGGSPNLAVGFDNYEDYERLAFEGTFDHDLTANLALGVSVLWEDYTIDSFIRQDLRNYLPGALLIVADDGEYQVLSAGVRMTARF